MSVVESWSRVMSLLQEHAPADHADLPGPASEHMLAAAEQQMGIPLPRELRAWLLQNNLDLPEEDVDDDVACCGFAGFPDEGMFFLGIRAIEKLYANHSMPGGVNPPDQPDNPFWSISATESPKDDSSGCETKVPPGCSGGHFSLPGYGVGAVNPPRSSQ